MSAVLDPPAQIDGRELRSIRTRAAIIDAWLELMSEGDLAPTAREVADRARIGLRTVFQHFSDMTALQVAASACFLKRAVQTVKQIAPDLPLSARIDGVVDNRARLFESVTMLRRACERQEWMSVEVQAVINEWESIGETATSLVFAPEFGHMSVEDRDTLGTAVDALVSWSTWNQLRHRRSLSVEQTCAVIRRSISMLLR